MEGGDQFMSGVDNRIVTMKFDNRQFEQSANQTIGTLGKIKESLNFGTVVSGTVRGLATITGALDKIGLRTPFSPMIKATNTGLTAVGGLLDRLGLKNPFSMGIQSATDLQRAAQEAGGPSGMGVLEGGVTAVSGKFIALTTIAVAALSQITTRAISSTTAWLKSFTIQPVLDGLTEYQTNLQAIQTVQANTDRPLPEINDALQQLNEYSDRTIYNFGEMAKNVGTFTAAGVDLETSVSAIKGIANMAALSGSNSQQAATAMYQLSQALASGKVGLMDWNSVVNAGMGGKKLQNALAQTAVAMGKLDEAQIKGIESGEQLTIAGNSFRESIMANPGEEAWLTSEILKNSLATLDGRFSDAALAQEELKNGTQKYKTVAERTALIDEARAKMAKEGVVYTDEQFEALKKLSDSAYEAATKVKTMGQVFQIAKETIASGWSASFQNIFGDLKQAKKLFTGMSNGLGEILKSSARARNELLVEWSGSAFGGRATLINALKDAWEALSKIVRPLKKGMEDIFPPKTVKDLRGMVMSFADLTEKMIPSRKTMESLRDISGGFFAILDIGKQIVMGVVDGFKVLFESIGGGEGDFLAFAAGIGNAIKEFDEFLKKSGLVTTFFETLGKLLSVPLSLLSGIGALIASLFSGFDEGSAGKLNDTLGNVGDRLTGLQLLSDRVKNWMGNLGDVFVNIGKVIGKALVGIGDVVASAFTADTFSQTLDVINTTLLGALVILIKNFFSNGVSVDLSGGLFDDIKETLGSVTSAFETMQLKLKADILFKLAVAIGVMAGSLLILSTIDPGRLTKALIAMTTGFAILIGALAVLMKVMGPAGIVKMYVVTAAVTKMAFSILILALALKLLAGIKFGDMLRGLAGLAAAMFIMTKAMVPLAAGSKGMSRAAFSMILMAIAMNLMATALKIFATMSWEEMAKGMLMLIGVLGAFALAFRVMPDLKAEAIGLIGLGIALNLIAVALKVFATMTWEEMLKGIIMLSAALQIIGITIDRMPKTMMLQAAALVVVAGALVILSGVLKVMGSMGWMEIAKGLGVLAATLLILGVALKFMQSSIMGAVSMVIMAGALAMLVPQLVILGAMKWESIGKALLMLASVFVILGLAAYAIGPMVVIIMGLGLSLLWLGAGLALAGAGALMAATAFGIVVAAGSAGIQILVGLLATIIAAIPPAMKAFGEGVVQFAVAIGNGAPAIATAFGKILVNILEQVDKAIPKLRNIFFHLLDVVIVVIRKYIPKFANAGYDMLLGILDAIADHLPDVIETATDIAVEFIRGIGKSVPRIVKAGIKMLEDMINGMAEAIRNDDGELGKSIANLGTAIVEGIAEGITAAADLIKEAALDAAKAAYKSVKEFFGIDSPSKLMRNEVGRWIPEGMAIGVRDSAKRPVEEIETMGKAAVSKMSQVMAGVNDAFALDPNLNPTVTPVLDLSLLTKEANKMSGILATSPIMPTMSYQTAADISAMTTVDSQSSDDGTGGPDGGPISSDNSVNLTLELHSPKPIDSVEAYRGGKTLISLAKEALQ
jgi:tape measure domain-containing protein